MRLFLKKQTIRCIGNKSGKITKEMIHKRENRSPAKKLDCVKNTKTPVNAVKIKDILKRQE